MINPMSTDVSTVAAPRPVRLPPAWRDFIAAYPPQEGYTVHTDFLSALAVTSGVQELYALALQGSHSPEAMGLPPLQEALSISLCRVVVHFRMLPF